MKLLPTSLMSWNEPRFFLLRLRNGRAWLIRILVALFIAGILLAAMLLTRPGRMELTQAILISLLAGVVLTLLPDISNCQREVTIYDDSIHYSSVYKAGISFWGEFKFPDIRRVQVLRPENWNRPHGAILIHAAGDTFLLGVPQKVPLETIANVLHRQGVPVDLTGWQPAEKEELVQVKDELDLAPAPGARIGTARIWPVGEQDGKLTPPTSTGIAVAMALGPATLSLLATLTAVVYVLVKWNATTVLEKCVIVTVPLTSFFVSLMYLIFVGQFLASRYLISVGRSVLRTRPNALLTGDEEQIYPVEIYDRDAWTRITASSTEFGFLQIDSGRRLFRFEGNKSRWEIPAHSLTACRVEEAHVGKEGNVDAEKRYFVVISAQREGESGGEQWEAGMIPTRTAIGHDGKEQRYVKAQELFSEISRIVAKA